MFYLFAELLQIDGVTQVLEHSKTDTDGRFSIMTTIVKFNSLIKFIADNLEQTVTALTDQYNLQINPCFPDIGLSFCLSKDDDSSDGTMQSYYLACTAIYSINSVGKDSPPASTMVPTQAWSKPPSIILAAISAVSTLTPSHQPSEKLTQMELENDRLNRKVNALSRQVQALLASQPASQISRLIADQPPVETLPPIYNIKKNNDVLPNLPDASMDKILDLLMLRLQQRVESDVSIAGTNIPSLPPQNMQTTDDESMDSNLTHDAK